MSESMRLQRKLNDLWTAIDVCEHYGVTAMAVHLWRKRKMPAIEIPGNQRPAVRFVPDDVKAWCKKEGIQPNPKTAIRPVRRRPQKKAA